MSDFVYLALTLLSFAGLAHLVGLLDARLRPEPDFDSDPDPNLDPDHPDRPRGERLEPLTVTSTPEAVTRR